MPAPSMGPGESLIRVQTAGVNFADIGRRSGLYAMPALGRDFDRAQSVAEGCGWLVGTPAQIVEQIGRREEAGVSRSMLHHLALDDFETLELIATHVLPQVRRSSPNHETRERLFANRLSPVVFVSHRHRPRASSRGSLR